MNLYWFRNNLRLRDNPSLVKAVQESKKIAFIYILEEQLLETHTLGFPTMGTYRQHFLQESLNDLQQQMETLGAELLLFQGKAIDVLQKLTAQNNVQNIYCSKEPNYNEQVQDATIQTFTNLITIDDNSLFTADSLPFAIDKLPMVFTYYRKKVEKYAEAREETKKIDTLSSVSVKAEGISPLELIKQPTVRHKHTAFDYTGGEKSAWQRIDDYFWRSENLAQYKSTRNDLIGEAYSSKLSPFLSIGTISPIAIYHEIKRFEKERCSNQSTYWLFFELLWRDFFRMTSLKYGKNIFHESGINNSTPTPSYQHKKSFEQWTNGDTKDTFVNANMLELKETGFMSNRGRQNVASYFVHDLHLPWHWGAAYFESLLIDYDCASNWCNWMYVAGVGNDPRHRKFNTQLQAERYDPKGEYQALWLS